MSLPTSRFGVEGHLLHSGDGIPLDFCMKGEGLTSDGGTAVEDEILTTGTPPEPGSSLSGSFERKSEQVPLSSTPCSAVPGLQ